MSIVLNRAVVNIDLIFVRPPVWSVLRTNGSLKTWLLVRLQVLIILRKKKEYGVKGAYFG